MRSRGAAPHGFYARNIQLPSRAPRISIAMSATKPKPVPRTICPVSHPAIKPTSKIIGFDPETRQALELFARDSAAQQPRLIGSSWHFFDIPPAQSVSTLKGSELEGS
jgi:hypothetical protein